YGITLTPNGHAYVTGVTYSSNFPVTSDAHDLTFGGPGKSDAFLARFTEPITLTGFTLHRASPTTIIGQSTMLSATVSAGNLASYTWNLGDGTVQSGAVVTHTYAQVGTYSVLVTATNPLTTLTDTLWIEILPPYTTLARVLTYEYDDLYRLTGADYSTGESFAYQYDAVGNRTVMTDAAGTHTYAYDHANRLSVADGDAYTWDNNGNLLADGTRTYNYDAANRLTSVNDGTSASSYVYDGAGNRTSQTVGGVTTSYVLDVAGALPEVIAATGSDTTHYVQVGGQILGQMDSGTWGYVLPDHLGSVRQLADAGGDVTRTQHYSPFGEGMAEAGPGSSVFGFAGEQMDATGLQYLRARTYAPHLGQFIQVDPFAGWPEQPGTLHPYLYGMNNPLRYVDPSGECYGGLSWLRMVEPGNCQNLDSALATMTNPNASLADRAFASTVAVGFTGSHVGLAAGLPVLLFNPGTTLGTIRALAATPVGQQVRETAFSGVSNAAWDAGMEYGSQVLRNLQNPDLTWGDALWNNINGQEVRVKAGRGAVEGVTSHLINPIIAKIPLLKSLPGPLRRIAGSLPGGALSSMTGQIAENGMRGDPCSLEGITQAGLDGLFSSGKNAVLSWGAEQLLFAAAQLPAPDISPPDLLLQTEEALRDWDRNEISLAEEGFAFDENGTFLFWIPPHPTKDSQLTELEAWQKAVIVYANSQNRRVFVTHNHPDDTSLSPADLQQLLNWSSEGIYVYELRAITPNHSYSLRIPEATPSFHVGKFLTTVPVPRYNAETYLQAARAIVGDEPSTFGDPKWHEVWTMVAKDLDWVYTAEFE
ncbi:MAG: PKD domain-containing protein, partial [Ardenticatenales bacterium]|nr:PKD domain-containing protein [Ardenticatenales bacterium]